MVALLDKREAPSVQKILASIAEEYPQVCKCFPVFLCVFWSTFVYVFIFFISICMIMSGHLSVQQSCFTPYLYIHVWEEGVLPL